MERHRDERDRNENDRNENDQRQHGGGTRGQSGQEPFRGGQGSQGNQAWRQDDRESGQDMNRQHKKK